MAKKPLVLDLSHHNMVKSFAEVYASGIRGIIHKSSQGSATVDKTYFKRRKEARAEGLLWGAYHFADNSDVKAQVANFLKAADPDAQTLLCLDWETNGRKTMSLAQAKEFLALVYKKTGQRPVLYSGNLIKEQVKTADDFLSQHRLWIAQYGPKPSLPNGWASYWLWQFTEAYNGPCGVEGKVDANHFGGVNLPLEWVEGRPNLSVAIDNTKVAPPEPVVPDSPSTFAKVKSATKEAAKSPALWARLATLAVLVYTWVIDGLHTIFNGVLSLVDALPDVSGQLDEQMTASQKMTEWLGIPWETVSLALVIGVGGIIIWRVYVPHEEKKA